MKFTRTREFLTISMCLFDFFSAETLSMVKQNEITNYVAHDGTINELQYWLFGSQSVRVCRKFQGKKLVLHVKKKREKKIVVCCLVTPCIGQEKQPLYPQCSFSRIRNIPVPNIIWMGGSGKQDNKRTGAWCQVSAGDNFQKKLNIKYIHVHWMLCWVQMLAIVLYIWYQE